MLKITNFLNKSKLFPFYLLSPCVYAIGTACEQIYFASKLTKKLKKKLILLNPSILQKKFNYKVCNQSIFDDLIINEHRQNFIIKFFLNIFVNIYFLTNRIILKLFRKFISKKNVEKLNFPNIGYDLIYHEHNFEEKTHNKELKNNSLLNFDIKLKNKIDEVNNFKKDFNFNFEEPYICFHLRDGHYRNDYLRKKYRNSNLQNYNELINYFLKLNFKVVKIGSQSSEKLNIHNKNFLDYSSFNEKNQYLDLYLIKNCYFFLGMDSGVKDTALMFKKPILKVNALPIIPALPYKSVDRMITKKMIHKPTNKKLSIIECYNLPFFYHNPANQIDDYEFIENTPEEIYNAGKEFLDILNDRDKINFNTNQIKLKNHISLRLREMQNENSLINDINYNRFINVAKSSLGSISSFYLKDNLL